MAYQTSESVKLDVIDVVHSFALRIACQVSRSLLDVIEVLGIIPVVIIFFIVILLTKVGSALELVEWPEGPPLVRLRFATAVLTNVYLAVLLDERSCNLVELSHIAS